MTTEALAQPRAGGAARWFIPLILFFGSGVALYVFILGPLQRYNEAQGWRQLQCRIEARGMRETGGRYEPVISYSYNVDGRWRQSDRYDFRVYPSMSLGEAQEAVDLYEVEKPALCYADPRHPDQAVLSPYDGTPHLGTLFPILVFMIPAAILFLKSVPRRRPAALPSRPPAPAQPGKWPATIPGPPPEPVAADSPKRRPIGALPPAPPEPPREEPPREDRPVSRLPFPIALSASKASPFPFGLEIPADVFSPVELEAVNPFWRTLLYLFNPRPTLTLSPRVPATGETTYLEWRLSSGAAGVRRLRIVLRGTETARGRGTAESVVFEERTLLDSTEKAEIAGGSKSFVIPAETMPSWIAPNHEISWELEVSAEIDFWPDSTDRFLLLVRPGRIPA